MVYECEVCGSALPTGVLACPKCGEGFDEAVPEDAEVPKRGWQAKSETVTSSAAPQRPTAPTPVTPEQHSDYTSPNEQPPINLHQPLQKSATNSSSGLQRSLAYAGVTALVAGIAIVIY